MALYRQAGEPPKKEAVIKKEAIVSAQKIGSEANCLKIEQSSFNEIVDNTVVLWRAWTKKSV